MMNVREAIESRRSIRKYLPAPVETEKIRLVLDSGRLAPSGHNTQPSRFLVLRDPEIIAKVGAACNHQPFVMKAPLLIVVLGDLKCRYQGAGDPVDILDDRFTDERQRIIRDCTIAGQTMILQAWDLGLGTCWVGDFEQLPMRLVLGVPADHFILSILVMGYPAESPNPRPRRALAEIVYEGSFGQAASDLT